jgi:pyruvate dehydrogenase E2 component (dihydrolipoamide acetyltransferase)
MSTDIQPIVMPKWGLAMKEGLLAAWHVEEGQEISAGQEIMDIETSKIANVFESPVGGPLRRVVTPAGETVPVGALLGVVAPPSVSDAEIDAYVAEFQERFAAKAAEAEDEVEPEPIEAGGWRINHLTLGEGPDVVLIHGYGGDLNNWLFNQPVLAESHRTHAIDLPGHGGSSKDVGSGDLATLTGAVLAFLDAKGIDKAHLVGHSLGGAIALQLALDHPGRVSAATLICPAALGPDINMDYIEGFIAARRGKHLKPVLEMLVADPELISRDMIEDILKFKRLDGVEAALKTIASAVFPNGRQAVDLSGRIAEAKPPLQIIWGTKDRIVPPSHAERVSGVPVHKLDCGHLAHMEKASEVNRLVGELA